MSSECRGEGGGRTVAISTGALELVSGPIEAKDEAFTLRVHLEQACTNLLKVREIVATFILGLISIEQTNSFNAHFRKKSSVPG